MGGSQKMVRIRKKARSSPNPLKVLREQPGLVYPEKGIRIYHLNTKSFSGFHFFLDRITT